MMNKPPSKALMNLNQLWKSILLKIIHSLFKNWKTLVKDVMKIKNTHLVSAFIHKFKTNELKKASKLN